MSEASPTKKYHFLSDTQKRFWQVYQANAGMGPDNLAAIFRIDGRLNVALWLESAKRTLYRYEILRTEFIQIKGRPFQIISSDIKIGLKNLTKRSISSKKLDKIIEQTTKKTFRLKKGNLGEIAIIKLRPRHFVLAVSVQPIIADHWSLILIIDEIFHCYKNFLEGAPAASNLIIQYKDFVAQEKLLKNDSCRQKKYWHDFFSKPAPRINLKKLSLEPAYRGKPEASLQQFNFSKETTKKIRALCQKHRISLFDFLFTAFYIFLSKISGENDPVALTLGARRSGSLDLAGAIGCFTDIVAMRVSLKKDQTFSELLVAIRKNLATNLSNQETLPFYPRKNLANSSFSPFKNVLFYLCSDLEKNKFTIAGLRIKIAPAYAERPYFDDFNLKIQAVEANNQIVINFRHNNLYSPASVKKWFTDFKSCVNFFLRDPAAEIGDFFQ